MFSSGIKWDTKSETTFLRSIAGWVSLGPARLAGCAVIASLLTACTAVPKLDANFDADPLGPPPSAPTPTPPNDFLNWREGFLAPTVVADSAGGRSVRIVPLPAFTRSPDDRRVSLIAVSDYFTTSPPANIRGSVRLRLDGLGTVGFGLRTLQGEQTLDFIGGFEVSNYLSSGGGVSALQGFKGARLSDPYSLPTSGNLSSYSAGSVIDVNWSIDQASRTFAVGVSGGPSQSSTFSAVSDGVTTTPIQRLIAYIWMQRPTSSTVLFIDRLHAEEYK